MIKSSVSALIKLKREAKKDLAKKLSFSRKRPLLGIIIDNELEVDIEKKIERFLDGVSVLDVEVVVLADSNLELFSMPNVIIFPYSRSNRKNLLEAADMALSFDFSDIEEMLLNGVIPISSERGEISDYNPSRETGNSFIYRKDNHWSIFEALIRARETYKLPYDWKHIIRQGFNSVVNNTPS